MKKNFWFLLTLLLALAVMMSACNGEATPESVVETTEAPADVMGTEEPTVEPTEAPADVMGTEEPTVEPTEAPAGESFYDQALAGAFAGTTVTMLGPFVDEDEAKFNDAVAEFEELTGIDIQYEGTTEFEATVTVRFEGGNPPDITDFPQPGLLANLAQKGHIMDVSSFISAEHMQTQYNQSWLDMAMLEGAEGPIMAGVWQRFNGKSLVWYPKAAFDEAGYAIPETWDDLIALSDQIVADGDAPWCIGIESGAATGWPATDWMEEIMLRTTSLDNYDMWVTGALPFASPEVTNAAQVMSDLWLKEGYVLGGQNGIVETSFRDAPTPMFEEPPRCWLHKQGNFITSFFPEEAAPGVDYDFFYLPPIDETYGKPFLVAGDIMAMAATDDKPEVKAVMDFFTRGESVKSWLAAGGALSPHLDAELDWYEDNLVERGIAEIVQQSTSFRFDGSDLMPGEVGAGSFWKGMTDYFSGAADLDTALEAIDAAWPSSE